MRLDTFVTEEQCGQWNGSLAEDLVADRQFTDATNNMHEWVADHCLGDDQPTTDGVGITNVGIELGTAISVDFQLWFMVNNASSCSAAPARFTVHHDQPRKGIDTATFGCGLRDSNGRFWYPRRDKQIGRFDTPPDSTDDWAYFKTKNYGDASLSAWLSDRKPSDG